jgi:hypothetical protein
MKKNASEFVRSQSSKKSAAEVVEAGAKKGIKFSAGLVYAVRSYDKKKAGNVAKVEIPVVVAKVAKAPKTKPIVTAPSIEDTFRACVAEIGRIRAKELLFGEGASVAPKVYGSSVASTALSVGEPPRVGYAGATRINLKDHIMNNLRGQDGFINNPKAIYNAIHGYKEKSVFQALTQLCKEGLVERRAKGTYGLASV